MRCVVVIPTYNEAESIGALVPRVLDAADGLHVLIVDDGSPDGTGRIADTLAARDPRVHVLHRAAKEGLGRAYQAGMGHALGLGAALVGQMDGDGSHDPRYLPAMLEAVEAGDADVAIGSRYLRGVAVVDWPLHRLALSVAANAYARATTGLPVRDCTSGFKLWNGEALRRSGFDRIRSSDYAFQVEHLWRAHRLGMRLVEVPIVFTERRQGRTNLTLPALVESALLPLRLLGRRPDGDGR